MSGHSLFNESGTIGKHGHVDDEPDVTAMIDMTFLLLAFFMVTSSMDAGSTLKLPPARHGKGLGSQNSTVFTIFFEEGKPEVYASDSRKEYGPLSLSEITAEARKGVAEQHTTVLIKADRETPSGFVEEVARAAGEAEGVKEFFVGIRDYSM